MSLGDWYDIEGAEGSTIRSIRTDGWVPSLSIEYRSRFVYCISFGKLRKKISFDDSDECSWFDPYGWSSAFTLRRVQFTDRILAYCKSLGDWYDIEGAEGLTIRSICTDGWVPLRSLEYSLPIVYCISLGGWWWREQKAQRSVRSVRIVRARRTIE